MSTFDLQSPDLRPLASQLLDDFVEQVRHAVAVLRGNFDNRIEAQLKELHRRRLRPLVVGLVDRDQHGLVGLAQLLGDTLVARHQPFAPIDDENSRSAPAMARCPCRITSSCSGSSLAPNMPPVSNSSKVVPRQTAGRASESRVVPAIGATIARRVPVMRLKSVDFPTFGRPDQHDGWHV